MPSLFEPLALGALTVPNRIFMAPLTRMRAGTERIPNDLMAEYYGQRATAGLIISEATVVSERGNGYPCTPGIYNDAQVEGWKKVTSSVHAKGGHIFLQLWHCGRVGHPDLYADGGLPVAPSAIAITKGQAMTQNGMKPHVVPRALETSEIPGLIAEYVEGAKRAQAAGFDGVEIHNANGYLLDQFIRSGSNQRTDRYGGSLENRVRLTLEVVEAVTHVWGADRVGIRFSPTGVFNDMSDANPLETFSHVLKELNRFGLAYAHVTEITQEDIHHGAVASHTLRDLQGAFAGPVVTAGGFDRAKAEEYLKNGWADAVAFGVPFIANPDLPRRLQENAPLNPPDETTFYAFGPKGYTDYPALG
jgi:N-ethylmaleimide reductase